VSSFLPFESFGLIHHRDFGEMTSMAYQPPIPMMMMMPNTAVNPQQEKINRELFVGNTPPGTSELLILHFLNAAMRRVGLCEPTETPIVDSRVNNKFAFIELSTAEFANKALSLNGIPFLGVFLKVSRPSKYTGPNVPSQTWQQLTGQVLPDGSSILDPEQEKLSRELFIGNTTPEMTESMIKEFLGNALQQVGLTNSPGNPIVACRVSGKFAFVELRTPQEATNALNLNNIPFLGTIQMIAASKIVAHSLVAMGDCLTSCCLYAAYTY
jgi:RNA recognition motif. (a.k.a. RRM, RBD, or RNP domain)